MVIKGEEEWEVEKILNKRKVRGKEKFLVWWKGFTAEADTWEGRENLGNAKEVLRDFEREYGMSATDGYLLSRYQANCSEEVSFRVRKRTR